MQNHKPSREFKAFFLVLCTAWTAFVSIVAVQCMELFLPDDLRPHAFLGLSAFFLMLVGACACIFCPLYGMWMYVTSSDDE